MKHSNIRTKHITLFFLHETSEGATVLMRTKLSLAPTHTNNSHLSHLSGRWSVITSLTHAAPPPPPTPSIFRSFLPPSVPLTVPVGRRGVVGREPPPTPRWSCCVCPPCCQLGHRRRVREGCGGACQHRGKGGGLTLRPPSFIAPLIVRRRCGTRENPAENNDL